MERDLLPLSDWAFARISRLMHETIGLALNETKKHFIQCRLAPRIQKLGLPGFDHYLALITSDGDEGEFQVAVDLLTTNETYFFREPEHFEIIAGHARRLKSRSFSVWSAASSFGDEAYSIAMLLAELQTQGHVGADWSILGTDISDRALRAAVEAVFPEERLLRVPPAYVRRYCLRGEGEDAGLVQIHSRLRAHVRFGQMNLCEPVEDIGMFDVVMLRNVLIYFDADTKAAVLNNVLSRLKPGGLLFIGMAEGRLGKQMPVEPVGPGAFRKLG